MFGVAVDTRIHLQDTMARILVVQEEPLVAIMQESALSDFGYHVLEPIENIKAAIHLAAMEHIDAVVVDTNIDGQIAEAELLTVFRISIPPMTLTYVDMRQMRAGINWYLF